MYQELDLHFVQQFLDNIIELDDHNLLAERHIALSLIVRHVATKRYRYKVLCYGMIDSHAII